MTRRPVIRGDSREYVMPDVDPRSTPEQIRLARLTCWQFSTGRADLLDLLSVLGINAKDEQ